MHLVAASGGNAGLAVACAGRALGLRCTIFLPRGASASTLAFFRMEGAEVREVGSCYQDALNAAEELVKAGENAYVLWVLCVCGLCSCALKRVGARIR